MSIDILLILFFHGIPGGGSRKPKHLFPLKVPQVLLHKALLLFQLDLYRVNTTQRSPTMLVMTHALESRREVMVVLFEAHITGDQIFHMREGHHFLTHALLDMRRNDGNTLCIVLIKVGQGMDAFFEIHQARIVFGKAVLNILGHRGKCGGCAAAMCFLLGHSERRGREK